MISNLGYFCAPLSPPTWHMSANDMSAQRPTYRYVAKCRDMSPTCRLTCRDISKCVVFKYADICHDTTCHQKRIERNIIVEGSAHPGNSKQPSQHTVFVWTEVLRGPTPTHPGNSKWPRQHMRFELLTMILRSPPRWRRELCKDVSLYKTCLL